MLDSVTRGVLDSTRSVIAKLEMRRRRRGNEHEMKILQWHQINSGSFYKLSKCRGRQAGRTGVNLSRVSFLSFISRHFHHPVGGKVGEKSSAKKLQSSQGKKKKS